MYSIFFIMSNLVCHSFSIKYQVHSLSNFLCYNTMNHQNKSNYKIGILHQHFCQWSQVLLIFLLKWSSSTRKHENLMKCHLRWFLFVKLLYKSINILLKLLCSLLFSYTQLLPISWQKDNKSELFSLESLAPNA